MRDRSAFLYMEPSDDNEEFATCGTCANFNREQQRCRLFSNTKNDEVDEDDTCGFYVRGPNTTEESTGLSTKEEAGFFDGPPQCHRCNAYDDRDKSHIHCDLYVQLTRMFPRMWDLKEEVKPHACCNAWEGGTRSPDNFGPYGPIPDPDDPTTGGLIMKVMEGPVPSTSKAQHGFMAMSRTTEGRAKLKAHGKKPAPASVANEFMHADKGRHFTHLGRSGKGK